MATGQNINMRVPDELLTSIDDNAKQMGLNRTQYILSWLPDTHEHAHSNDQTSRQHQEAGGR